MVVGWAVRVKSDRSLLTRMDLLQGPRLLVGRTLVPVIWRMLLSMGHGRVSGILMLSSLLVLAMTVCSGYHLLHRVGHARIHRAYHVLL